MKKKLIIYPIVYAVLIGLFVLGTFYDLQISKTLADLKPGEYFSKNFFANFIEIFTELPIFILLGACFVIVGFNLMDKWEKHKLIIQIILGMVVFFAFTLCFYRCVECMGQVYGFSEMLQDNLGFLISCALFGIIFVILAFWLGSLIGTEKMGKLFYFALAFIIVIALTFIATQLLKGIVNRPRFRALNIIGIEKYSPWYKIYKVENLQFYSSIIQEEGFVSFPSGHTTWFGTAIMLSFLPRFIKMNKKATLCFTIIPPVLTLIVAFARIIAGAHFLTDVTFSLLITIILEEIFVNLTLFIQRKKEKKLEQELLVK